MKYGDAHRYVVILAIYLFHCRYKSLDCHRGIMMLPILPFQYGLKTLKLNNLMKLYNLDEDG